MNYLSQIFNFVKSKDLNNFLINFLKILAFAFIIYIIYSSIADAKNWVPESKFKTSQTVWTKKNNCEAETNETCYNRNACTKRLNKKDHRFCMVDNGKVVVDSDGSSKAEEDDAAMETKMVVTNGVRNSIKRVKCGRRVLGLVHFINSPKDLSDIEVKELTKSLSDIKLLLDTGFLETAHAELTAFSVDDKLVTAEDKTKLINRLNDCIGN